MIQGEKVLAIIPARGGSKGVPRKNIRTVAGKPLIAWTIEEARKSRFIDRLILSSEDEEIIRIAREWECEVPFVRPSDLARDDTPGIATVLHALMEIQGYHYVVLLQPTSPLRGVEDIDGCIEMCVKDNLNATVSVTESEKSPYWMYTIDAGSRLVPILPKPAGFDSRQTLPIVYALNGAVYVAEIGWLRSTKTFLMPETGAYIMPKTRSIDIDSEQDIILCDFLLKKNCVNASTE